jgi:hypothetical protein
MNKVFSGDFKVVARAGCKVQQVALVVAFMIGLVPAGRSVAQQTPTLPPPPPPAQAPEAKTGPAPAAPATVAPATTAPAPVAAAASHGCARESRGQAVQGQKQDRTIHSGR